MPVSADAATGDSLLANAILSAGVLYGPGGSPEQPSIRVAPATDAITLYLVRAERPERQIKSLPIERTVPLRVTRRQNGDSLRRAIAFESRRSPPPLLFVAGSLTHRAPTDHTATAAACFA
jgi:hypothetical protein